MPDLTRAVTLACVDELARRLAASVAHKSELDAIRASLESGVLGEPVVVPDVPSPAGPVAFRDREVSPTWTRYDPACLLIGGTTAATEPGTYEATFTPRPGYVWSGGERAVRTVEWTISREVAVPVPAARGPYQYDGTVKKVEFDNLDEDYVEISGLLQEIAVGEYHAVATLKGGCSWEDGTRAPKDIPWRIEKGVPFLGVDFTEAVLSPKQVFVWNDIHYVGDGKLAVTVSNPSLVQVTLRQPPQVTEPDMRITGKGAGKATVTLSASAGPYYPAAQSVTCSVDCQLPPSDITKVTATQAQDMARGKQAANFWTPGDAFPASAKGTAGSIKVDGSGKLVIIGFNHNISKEMVNGSTETGTIHVMMGQDPAGRNFAFCDTEYGKTGTTATGYRHRTSAVNSGGWQSSGVLSTCAQFRSMLLNGWSSAMKPVPKYTDKTCNGTNTQANVAAFNVYGFVPSEVEVFGSATLGNQYEASFQIQYAYFANGNSKVAQKSTDMAATAGWWLRTAVRTNKTSFVFVNGNGEASSTTANVSGGVRPCFVIG